MRKILKYFLIILGAILILGGGGWLGYELLVPLKELWTGGANHISDNPAAWIAVAAILAVAGGILLGIGIGFSKLSFKQKLEARQSEEAAKNQPGIAKDAATMSTPAITATAPSPSLAQPFPGDPGFPSQTSEA